MTKPIIFINLILFLICWDVVAQNDNGRRWEFFIGSGLSFPVGVYSKKNPEKSAILNYLGDNSFKVISGFAKEKCGFAKTGWNYSAGLKYYLSPKFMFVIHAGRFINHVETDRIAKYLTGVTNKNMGFSEPDYELIFFTAGIGYTLSVKKFDINLILNAGYSRSDFPYYEQVLLFTSMPPEYFPPVIFAHDGPRPDLNSLAVGGGISVYYPIGKRIKTGLQALYQQANFAYHMSNHAIPGGSETFEIDDILKVRVINADLVLSYVF